MIRPRLPSPSGRTVTVLLAGAALVGGAGWIAQSLGERNARDAADRTAGQMANAHSVLLASELQKYRLLPIVLGEYPEASIALRRSSREAARALDRKLESLAARTDAAVIYLIDRNGMTLAASNWRRPDTFVGQNFGFRPYFSEAMRNGQAELFALGSISGRPGMFIARSILEGGSAIGVIVIKVEFNRLETDWRRQPGYTFVTDRHGVVIVTSRGDWRFRTTEVLDAAVRAEIKRALQFGNQPLDLFDLARNGDGDTVVAGQPMRVASTASAIDGGRLHYLEPLAPRLAATAVGTRLVVVAATLLAALLIAFLFYVRVRSSARKEAWRALETEVATRTSELRDSNDRLLAESLQRQESDAHLRTAQDELARANRLSSLGQITASVAHEINQPVAALRTTAENAGRFLERGNLGRVARALSEVVAMADRVGEITSELRGFAGRGRSGIDRINVDVAIGGSMLLLGDRFRAEAVFCVRNQPGETVWVMAERIRLEQILVNLLQNALDAVSGTEDPTIGVAVRAEGDRVEIEIYDNGPGFDAGLVDDAFTPFVTGKANGLGLGLGIARDLAREFGGELRLGKSSLGGASLTLELKRAH